jgi:C4-dicarboxylate-specific signal transduction histidine kinase
MGRNALIAALLLAAWPCASLAQETATEVPGSPVGCESPELPPAPWRPHVATVIALGAVSLLQGVLIWSLAMQTSRRRLAERELSERTVEMAHVSRLSTISALTASIAHEINQPVGAILSNTEAVLTMLEQSTLTDETLREILTDVRDETLRAGEVIRAMRRLLARSHWNPSMLETNAEVAEALRHVASEAARSDVRITPVFGRAMPAVPGDSIQLQQVVINLVSNAIQAVATLPRASREVRIETRAQPGGVEIAVADLGPGISPEHAAQIFHSNFTTKEEGMGLGLAIVRMIVEMHGGRVSFEPNAPRGAVFRVALLAANP